VQAEVKPGSPTIKEDSVHILFFFFLAKVPLSLMWKVSTFLLRKHLIPWGRRKETSCN